MQAAELADPHAGGIQESDLGLVFGIGDGINDRNDLFPGRYDRKILVEMQERDFSFIPVLMENVVEEIPELGDMDVDSTWIQAFHILQPANIGADFLPGNRGNGTTGKMFFDPVDIGGQIRDVGGDSTFGKVAERKDIPVFLEINGV